MIARRARLLTVFFVVAAATSSSRARADNAADVRFNEGLDFARAGKFEQARQAFLQAYALHQDPATLWNLAIAEMKTDHSVDALRHIKAYLKTPKPDPGYVSVAPSLIEKLNAKTGHIAVDAPQGADISVDNEKSIERAPLADVLDVAPGEHDVLAQIGTSTAREHVVVAAGQTVRVKLDLGAPPPTTAQPASQHPTQGTSPIEPPREEHRGDGTIWMPMTFILGGATLLAGGAWLYFNANSLDAADRGDKIRAEHSGTQCPEAGGAAYCQDLREARNDQERAADTATVMGVGTVVLGAATVTSLVLWLTHRPSRSQSTALVPYAGPSATGAFLQGRF